MLTRDLGKAVQVLDKVKELSERNANPTFTKDSNFFDVGYAQAHKDMVTRIKLWENKLDLSGNS